jgi:hypothetical protein
MAVWVRLHNNSPHLLAKPVLDFTIDACYDAVAMIQLPVYFSFYFYFTSATPPSADRSLVVA